VVNVHREKQEPINVRIKLLSAAIGVGAVAAMFAVFVAYGPQQGGGTLLSAPGEITKPQPTYAKTITKDRAPTSLEIATASPPVTAEPAPTEEPG
jgi:hypothetical protein